jgi:hypothetical protein
MNYRVPPRVAQRPDPRAWSDSELMNLAEAAALFFPDGVLTTASLRTAAKRGQLDIVEVARKHLTCKAAIARMSVCKPQKRHATGASEATRNTPLGGVSDAVRTFCGDLGGRHAKNQSSARSALRPTRQRAFNSS